MAVKTPPTIDLPDAPEVKEAPLPAGISFAALLNAVFHRHAGGQNGDGEGEEQGANAPTSGTPGASA